MSVWAVRMCWGPRMNVRGPRMNVRGPGDHLGRGKMCRGRPRRVCRTGVSVPESVRGEGGRRRPNLAGEERLCSRGKLLSPGASWRGGRVRDGGQEEAKGLPATGRGRWSEAGIAGRAEAYAALGVTLGDGNWPLWKERYLPPQAQKRPTGRGLCVGECVLKGFSPVWGRG